MLLMFLSFFFGELLKHLIVTLFYYVEQGPRAILVEWLLDSKYFVREDRGSSPGVAVSLVWISGMWRNSTSSAIGDRPINGYLKKYREDKQEGQVKAQDGRPPYPPFAIRD